MEDEKINHESLYKELDEITLEFNERVKKVLESHKRIDFSLGTICVSRDAEEYDKNKTFIAFVVHFNSLIEK